MEKEERKMQQRSIESRKKINNAAYELFAEKGYYNTNTKEIARRAGVSVGNFYNYYKDKGELYCELVNEYAQASANALSQLADSMIHSEEPIDAFAAYVDAQLARAVNAGRLFGDCNMVVHDYPQLAETFEKGTEVIIAVLQNMLEHMEGIRHRESYSAMARLLYTMVNEASNDIMRFSDDDYRQTYIDELICAVSIYLFGKEWRRNP